MKKVVIKREIFVYMQKEIYEILCNTKKGVGKKMLRNGMGLLDIGEIRFSKNSMN